MCLQMERIIFLLFSQPLICCKLSQNYLVLCIWDHLLRWRSESMAFKKIGILGGMGPEASADFYCKIIQYCQEKYDAVQDTDYPSIVIYSLPLYGFNESGITDKNLVLKQLIHGIEIL